MNGPEQTRTKLLQNRRDFFNILLRAGAALPCGIILAQEANAKVISSKSVLGRRVFAHWHIFRRSFDNKPYDLDVYANYLSPAAMGGKYRNSGGFIRERPLTRSPLEDPDWAVLDMVHEVRTAAAAGIDGFQFNIGSVKRDSPLFWSPLLDMLAACERANLAFSIMLSIDCAIMPQDWPLEDLVDALTTIAKRSPIARTSDGRLILGAFAPEKWPVARWKGLLTGLAAKGEIVYFAPSFLSASEAAAYLPLTDAASIWGGNRASQFPAITKFAGVLRALGKGWIAPIWPQDFRPKDLWFAEANNSGLFRRGWERAIEIDSDAVAIATWNDYSEGSEIQPSTSIQYAFCDLTKFYASWYKEQKRPRIVKDVLFYFHRVEWTDSPSTGSLQPSQFARRFADSASNEVELLGFLTRPGRLEIETRSGIARVDATEGITSLRAPIALGRPLFRLIRNEKAEISFSSAYEVREKSSYQDLLYHGGSSDRSPVPS